MQGSAVAMAVNRMAPKMEDMGGIMAGTLEHIKGDSYQEWEREVQAAMVEGVAIEEQVQVECSRVVKEDTTVEIGVEWRGEMEAAALEGNGVTKVEAMEDIAVATDGMVKEQVHGIGVTQKGTDLDNKGKTGHTEGNL